VGFQCFRPACLGRLCVRWQACLPGKAVRQVAGLPALRKVVGGGRVSEFQRFRPACLQRIVSEAAGFQGFRVSDIPAWEGCASGGRPACLALGCGRG